MYCIHCGKKLKEGEVCSCRKKKKKRILHTILGWLCWLLGAGVFAYLFLINKEFLQELEIPFLKGFAGYLAFGLPAILFLVGMILSIRGILSKKTRAFAGSLFLLSFVGILGMGALLGLRVRKLNEAVETIAVGLDDSSAERVKEIYEDAWNGEKTVLKEKLLEQAEQIRADFQAETLTYECKFRMNGTPVTLQRCEGFASSVCQTFTPAY